MKKRKKVDLREIFLGLQKQMRAKLSLNKKILTHPVSKGDASELEWLDMLGSYLPTRYQVEKAFVIDCEGKVSDQIDIVIFDRHYSPFLLRQNGALYVPAESVYVVIEVKPTLNPASIKYTANKAFSIRRLKRTSAPIIYAGGEIDKPKEPFEILAGILTIDGSCTRSVKEEINKLPENKRLHFGCSLSSGAFIVHHNDSLAFEESGSDDGLVFFFLKLLSSLQSMGTVPAMVIEEYIKKIKRKE
ncbi:hypothetical protein KAT60_00080 [Candidatus Woesebacteria bacterium]|nr:hypothetical protein [Candidatus Woesebacteria bacterium]